MADNPDLKAESVTQGESLPAETVTQGASLPAESVVQGQSLPAESVVQGPSLPAETVTQGPSLTPDTVTQPTPDPSETVTQPSPYPAEQSIDPMRYFDPTPGSIAVSSAVARSSSSSITISGASLSRPSPQPGVTETTPRKIPNVRHGPKGLVAKLNEIIDAINGMKVVAAYPLTVVRVACGWVVGKVDTPSRSSTHTEAGTTPKAGSRSGSGPTAGAWGTFTIVDRSCHRTTMQVYWRPVPPPT